LINFATRRYHRLFPHLSADIDQEAKIALVDALRNFEDDKASGKIPKWLSFGTYSTRQMRWKVLAFLDKFVAHKDGRTDSLSEVVAGDGEDALTRSDVVGATLAAEEESAGRDEERLLSRIHDLRLAVDSCRTLTRGERQAVKEFLITGNCEAAATQLYRTRQSVGQALDSAITKLRKHLKK
jgi:hypothetical protein